MGKKRKIWHSLAAFAVSLLLLAAFAAPYWGRQPVSREETFLSRVEQVYSDSYEVTAYSGGTIYTRVIYLRARLLEGEQKGRDVLVRQEFDELAQHSAYPAREGDRLYIYVTGEENGTLTGFASDYDRIPQLFVLTAIFLGGLVILGGFQGARTVVSLALTMGSVFFWLIPAVFAGKNPGVQAVLVCAYSAAATLTIVIGFNRKSLAAGLGCLGGVLIAGLLSLAMEYSMRITGLTDSDAGILLNISPAGAMDLRGILFAGIMVGALGAAMDVAISMASSLRELIQEAPAMGCRALMRSGMNIGKDMMGTMANTLLLAYAGGSIQVLLLLYAQQMPVRELLNREMVAVELLRAMAGSVGLLCTIPLTAGITVFLRSREPDYKQNVENNKNITNNKAASQLFWGKRLPRKGEEDQQNVENSRDYTQYLGRGVSFPGNLCAQGEENAPASRDRPMPEEETFLPGEAVPPAEEGSLPGALPPQAEENAPSPRSGPMEREEASLPGEAVPPARQNSFPGESAPQAEGDAPSPEGSALSGGQEPPRRREAEDEYN